MNEQYWTQIFSALLTPTIAIFGLILAIKQWKTSQSKLKMDLFEKRYSIYKATNEFISSIMGSGQVDDEHLFKFRSATKEAKWVLNSDIATYLDEQIWSESIDLQTLRSELEGVPAGEERTTNLQKQRIIKDRLLSQTEMLDKKFTPFLELKH
ncbi:hypothetical protein KA005_27095 [bacterium]|nr:hypothetical protein [bacterium]